MPYLQLSLANNPKGSDPIDGFYSAINDQHPRLQLTRDNSKIVLTKSYADLQYSNRTITIIKEHAVPYKEHVFIYLRFDVTEWLDNPFFTALETINIIDSESSATLLEVVATRLNLNLRAEGFWVESTHMDFTGGEVTPNFLLTATNDNLWFMGSKILWIHNGETDPTGGDYSYTVTLKSVDWFKSNGPIIKSMDFLLAGAVVGTINLEDIKLMTGDATFILGSGLKVLNLGSTVKMRLRSIAPIAEYDSFKITFRHGLVWDTSFDYSDAKIPADASTAITAEALETSVTLP